jgi:hypothetical protein
VFHPALPTLPHMAGNLPLVLQTLCYRRQTNWLYVNIYAREHNNLFS